MTKHLPYAKKKRLKTRATNKVIAEMNSHNLRSPRKPFDHPNQEGYYPLSRSIADQHQRELHFESLAIPHKVSSLLSQRTENNMTKLEALIIEALVDAILSTNKLDTKHKYTQLERIGNFTTTLRRSINKFVLSYVERNGDATNLRCWVNAIVKTPNWLDVAIPDPKSWLFTYIQHSFQLSDGTAILTGNHMKTLCDLAREKVEAGHQPSRQSAFATAANITQEETSMENFSDVLGRIIKSGQSQIDQLHKINQEADQIITDLVAIDQSLQD